MRKLIIFKSFLVFLLLIINVSIVSEILADNTTNAICYNGKTVISNCTLDTVASAYTFSKPLRLGSNNNNTTEVYNLQKFLNSNGYIISNTGFYSPGNENKYFGAMVRKALIKFQKANSLVDDGIFGPKTREKVNAIMKANLDKVSNTVPNLNTDNLANTTTPPPADNNTLVPPTDVNTVVPAVPVTLKNTTDVIVPPTSNIDSTSPVVTFSVTSPSYSTTITPASFSATDNVGVTGYALSPNAISSVGQIFWSNTPSITYTFPASSFGAWRHLYGCAKDQAGNVACTDYPVMILDVAPPVIDASVTDPAPSLKTVPVIINATDNDAVVGYSLTESSSVPSSWSTTKPNSYTFGASSTGAKTLYAWAKDNAGNTAYKSATVNLSEVINTPDTISPIVTFTVDYPALSTTITPASFSATDNVGVTGYALSPNSIGSVGQISWSNTPNITYTFPATSFGKWRHLYGCARDQAGNVACVDYPIMIEAPAVLGQSANTTQASSLTSNYPTLNPMSPIPPFKTRIQYQTENDQVEVYNLQRFLNNKGYVIAKTGPGSPGYESTVFGNMTRRALIKFQEDNKLDNDGIFGTDTREFVNNILK